MTKKKNVKIKKKKEGTASFGTCLIFFGKFWKILENFGKLKVFQYFCSKLSKNLQFSNYFKIFKDLDCRRAWG